MLIYDLEIPNYEGTVYLSLIRKCNMLSGEKLWFGILTF
jgi:hypothetical protein